MKTSLVTIEIASIDDDMLIAVHFPLPASTATTHGLIGAFSKILMLRKVKLP